MGEEGVVVAVAVVVVVIGVDEGLIKWSVMSCSVVDEKVITQGNPQNQFVGIEDGRNSWGVDASTGVVGLFAKV